MRSFWAADALLYGPLPSGNLLYVELNFTLGIVTPFYEIGCAINWRLGQPPRVIPSPHREHNPVPFTWIRPPGLLFYEVIVRWG